MRRLSSKPNSLQDHLALVSITFPEARFADVRRAANEQLGAGKDWSVGIIAGMNGTFKAEITIWESEERAAVLQQFDRKINRSSLIYGTPAAMAPPSAADQSDAARRHARPLRL